MNKAAQALGRLARGVPKNFSAEEIAFDGTQPVILHGKLRNLPVQTLNIPP